MRFSSLLLGFASLAPSLALCAAPASADVLQSWNFDKANNQLTFTTDEAVTPVASLVANPSRIVLDLPGIRFDRAKVNQSLGGVVKGLRIARFEKQTTRLVIDLDPAYSVDPTKVIVKGDSATRWTVKLPAFTSAEPSLGWPEESQPQPIAVTAPPVVAAAPSVSPLRMGELLPTGQSLDSLKQSLNSLRKRYTSISSGLVFVDLENGDYVDFNGSKRYPTASIIKLPILLAFFQDVDAGKVSLDETWTMTRDVVVGGSGTLQDRPVNSKYKAIDIVNKMMVISDNTATNMVIKRMGGLQVLNQRFDSWGLSQTRLRNWLPDLGGTNTTTLKELAQLLVLLDRQQLLGDRSQIQALDIMTRVKNRSLLAAGLGKGATIAHKTGYIGYMLGDAGIIKTAQGRRYLAAVIVESASGDPKPWDFVPAASRLVYNHFNRMPIASQPSKPVLRPSITLKPPVVLTAPVAVPISVIPASSR
jgi:beta-lactamase class A